MATPPKTATKKSTAATKTTRAVVAKPAATKKAVSKPASKPTPVEAKIKHKLVRDSFTIPKAEYVVLDGLKLRAADLKRPTKKSELIRAGIAVLKSMSDKEFLAAVNGVQSLKTGRPKFTGPKKA